MLLYCWAKTLQPIQQAVSGWKRIVEAREQYQRLNDLLQAFPPSSEKMDLPEITGAITASDVEVAAPGASVPILKGVSLSIEAGTAAMIVGPSGSGKSTLVRAVLGLWPTLKAIFVSMGQKRIILIPKNWRSNVTCHKA